VSPLERSDHERRKRIEAIRDKEVESSEEERDQGKRPFLASVIREFTKLKINPTSDEEESKESKMNDMRMISITRGPSNLKGRSRGTTKRRIAIMCFVRIDALSYKKKDRQMLGFNDNDYPRGTQNEIFPLFFITTMAQHVVSKLLVDHRSSYDVMYHELFKKLGPQYI
jgi:hypothetical protein